MGSRVFIYKGLESNLLRIRPNVGADEFFSADEKQDKADKKFCSVSLSLSLSFSLCCFVQSVDLGENLKLRTL